MLKIAATFCAALITVSAFSTSAEARHGGFSGARMGGFSGARMGFAGPGRMGIAGPGRMGFAGPGRFGIAGPGRMGLGRVAWAGRGNWSGGRWAGNWRGGHWRGGRFWPWWGVGAGLAVAAAWPYYGGSGYGYDGCVQLVPDWGWVNVCNSPYYGGYGYY